MNYEWIRKYRLKIVTCEIILMCLGRNVRKFFTLVYNDNIKINFW